jgi:hypothetical protein
MGGTKMGNNYIWKNGTFINQGDNNFPFDTISWNDAVLFAISTLNAANVIDMPMIPVSTDGTATPGTIEEDSGNITRTIPLAPTWGGLDLQFINVGTGTVNLICAQQIYSGGQGSVNGIIPANTNIVLEPGVWILFKSDNINIVQRG